MLAAYPGVPIIYYGDEIGLATMGPESARIPMPWAHPERWDQRRLAKAHALFTARADHTPIRVPATVAGSELVGLAGSADLHADADGLVTLPANKPTFGMWRLGE